MQPGDAVRWCRLAQAVWLALETRLGKSFRRHSHDYGRYPEERGVQYAIRIPANKSLELEALRQRTDVDLI